jgi:hypothetical protein
METHPRANDLLGRAVRGIRHHRGGGPTTSMRATLHSVFVGGPTGIEETGAFVPELNRIERVCALIVRGLFFHELGRALREGYSVRAHLLGAAEMPAEHAAFLAAVAAKMEIERGRAFSDLFEYRFTHDPQNPDFSAWRLDFYQTSRIVSVTKRSIDFPPGSRLY